MLSIKQCRELMPDSNKLTDKEVGKIRGSLYDMGQLAMKSYFEENKERGVEKP